MTTSRPGARPTLAKDSSGPQTSTTNCITAQQSEIAAYVPELIADRSWDSYLPSILEALDEIDQSRITGKRSGLRIVGDYDAVVWNDVTYPLKTFRRRELVRFLHQARRPQVPRLVIRHLDALTPDLKPIGKIQNVYRKASRRDDVADLNDIIVFDADGLMSLAWKAVPR